MIDTKRLEQILENTLSDKSIIHPAVAKVGKAPDDLSIDVLSVGTHSDEAQFSVKMQWNVTNRIESDVVLSTFNSYRLKWFKQVVRRLEYHAEGSDLEFVADFDSFEFGVRNAGGKAKQEWQIILCAEMVVSVFGKEFLELLNRVEP